MKFKALLMSGIIAGLLLFCDLNTCKDLNYSISLKNLEDEINIDYLLSREPNERVK